MKIAEFEVEVEKKPIKNIHLSVYPPDGRVHISVPQHLSDWEISTFLFSKLSWIRRNYNDVLNANRQTTREFVTGESHYLFGERLLLQLHFTEETPKIVVSPGGVDIYISKRADRTRRAELLFVHYKKELKKELERLLEKWCERVNEHVGSINWEIKNIEKKWGECFPNDRRILFNILLARVPITCIEYIVVHELVHLKVREHNDDFRRLLNQYLPDWQARKQELDDFPVLNLN